MHYIMLIQLDTDLQWGMTPLMLASKNGNKTCSKIMMDHGADVDAKSKEVRLYAFIYFVELHCKH